MTHINNIYRILALCLLLLCCNKASSQIVLGYCGDNIASTGLSNSKVDATISCAMALTPSMLSDYSICALTELRVGLSAVEGISSLKVWVRHHLNDEDLVSADVPVDEIAVGWNTIQLPTQVEISGEDSLFCGYTYTQTSVVKCISSNGTKKTPNSFFISNGNKWTDYTKNNSPVSIRAGVMPLYDNALRLTDSRLDLRNQQFGTDYKRIHVQVTFQNLGKKALTSYHLTASDNGTEPMDVALAEDTESQLGAFGEYATVSFWISPGHDVKTPQLDIPIILDLSSPNEDPEAILINCQDTLYYDLGSCSLLPDAANYVIEEYTSEDCGYAPIGQKRLREAIEVAHQINLGDSYETWKNNELDGYYTNYTIISRHEGYGPADTWRVSNGSDYQPSIFGEKELSFAPAMTVNRSRIPVSSTVSADSLGRVIANSSKPNLVSLGIDAGSFSFDASTRKIAFNAQVIFWSSTFCQSPNITFCLKQDKVPSHNQKNYYPDVYDSAYQYDVIRCYLNSKSGVNALFPNTDMESIMSGQSRIGDQLDTDDDGNHYRLYSFEGTVPDDIQSLEELTLVGYVYDKRPGGEIYGAYHIKPTLLTR